MTMDKSDEPRFDKAEMTRRVSALKLATEEAMGRGETLGHRAFLNNQEGTIDLDISSCGSLQEIFGAIESELQNDDGIFAFMIYIDLRRTSDDSPMPHIHSEYRGDFSSSCLEDGKWRDEPNLCPGGVMNKMNNMYSMRGIRLLTVDA